MKEMRAFPRLSLSCDIEYSMNTTFLKTTIGAQPKLSTADTTEQQKTVISKTKDISLGGICLITSSPLKIGDILNLSIRLKGFIKPIEAVGKVVWTQTFEIGGQKGYDNGIKFIEITETYKGILEKFIQKIFSV